MKSLAANHFYRGWKIGKGGEMNPTRNIRVIDCLELSLILKCSIYRQIFGNKLEYLEMPESSFVDKIVGPDHL
jgi:hypothetical protein